jgi:hypothetical protein
MRQIAIDKSIKGRRMVYKLNTELVFNYVMMYFLAWILPLMSIKIVFFPSKYNQQHNSPVFNAIMLLIDLWLLVGLYLMNKLVYAEGKSFNDNKNAIEEVLRNKYPEIVFTSGNPNVIRGQKTLGFLGQREKIITVLLKDTNIYINTLHTYRGGGLSFFHGITDYLQCVNIARSFKSTLL